MDALSQIGILLVSTLFSMYLLIVILRFSLQLARADFYNPMSQFIVKATNPLLLPLRKVIPGLFGLDIASLILAYIIQCAATAALLALAGGGFHLEAVITWSFIGLLAFIVNLYFWAMIIMIVASFIAPTSHNPILLLIRQLVEPLMAPFRRLIPPMGPIDLSPIAVFLIIGIIEIVLRSLAAGIGLTPPYYSLVIGI